MTGEREAEMLWAWSPNPSAWIGIVLCIVLLRLWWTRNDIILKKGKRREWDN